MSVCECHQFVRVVPFERGGALTRETRLSIVVVNICRDRERTKTSLIRIGSGRWAVAAAIDGKLYVVGGAEKHSTDGRSSAERYDPQSNAWEVVAPHPIGKIYASAAAVLEGKLYVMGGAEEDGDDGELSSVARYDPSTKEWEEVASMSTARRYPTAVVVDGVLHVMGGWAEDCDYLSSVERYDPESDAWVTVAGMALIEGGVGAVAGLQYALLSI